MKKLSNTKYEIQIQQLQFRVNQKKRELRKHKRSRIKAYFFVILSILCVFWISTKCSLKIQEIVDEKQERAYAKLDQDLWKWFNKAIGESHPGMEEGSTVLSKENRKELNQYIGSLKRKPTKTVELKEKNGIAYYQYVQKKDIGEYTIADAGTEIIFPGAIVRGDSLFQGTADYTLLATRRMPMYLTNTQIPDSSVRVNDVNYRTVSTVLHGYEAKGEQKAPQNWKYYLKSITSENDVKLSFGVSISDLGLDLGHSQTNEKSTVAVVYKQVYYSVNAEPLNSAVDYFEDGADLADLGEYEPAYVSSVDYGRMFVVFVSGNMSSSELNAKLGLCLKGVSIGTGISNVITDEELEVTIFQYGGKTGNANKLFEGKQGKLGVIGQVKEFMFGSEGEDDVVHRVNDFLEMDGELLNPEPLSYRLKYLSDNVVLPTIVIRREGVIPARDVRTVTLNLQGDMHLDFSDDAGMILSKTKKSGEENVKILWNSGFSGPITGTLDNRPVTLDLYAYKCGLKSSTKLLDYDIRTMEDDWQRFLGMDKLENVNIHILDSAEEMP